MIGDIVTTLIVVVCVALAVDRMLRGHGSIDLQPTHNEIFGPLRLAELEHECLEERSIEEWGHHGLCPTCYPVKEYQLGGARWSYINAGSITAEKIQLRSLDDILPNRKIEETS